MLNGPSSHASGLLTLSFRYQENDKLIRFLTKTIYIHTYSLDIYNMVYAIIQFIHLHLTDHIKI